MPVIEERLGKLNPPPTREIPILIGGGGEKVTLRIVAEHANIWHGFGNPERAARKSGILDDWCEKVGRDPKEIERSITVRPELVKDADRYVENGITHLVMAFGGPDYDLSPSRTSSPGAMSTESATKRPSELTGRLPQETEVRSEMGTSLTPLNRSLSPHPGRR